MSENNLAPTNQNTPKVIKEKIHVNLLEYRHSASSSINDQNPEVNYRAPVEKNFHVLFTVKRTFRC